MAKRTYRGQCFRTGERVAHPGHALKENNATVLKTIKGGAVVDILTDDGGTLRVHASTLTHRQG